MAMTRKKKTIIIVSAIILLVAIVLISKAVQKKEGTPVQTAKVEQKNRIESKVTASGEIRPVKFYDLQAEVSGRVEQIYVNEGDTVKKGQPLVRVDPTQYNSYVAGSEASVRLNQADLMNQMVAVQQAENNVNQARTNLIAAEADLQRTMVDMEYAQNEYNRHLQLVESGLITKSLFESVKSKYDQAKATVDAQKARVEQYKQQVKDAELGVSRAKSTLKSSEERVKQSQSNLSIQADQLQKTIKYSPIDGVVSSLPVKVGVFALANFSATPLLTVADMSQINAEIKVDETDISAVALGQKAKIKVDALGDQEIDGEVIEKGASAITRSGQTISQTTGSQEAKDFVVKIKLTPPASLRDKLRPGMSATAIITTSTVENVLAVPLQSIVPREDPDEKKEESKENGDQAAAAQPRKKEVDGVFIFGKDGRASFRKVETGIKGDQEIEIKSGLSKDEEIITGPYKTLRTLKDKDPVKREPKPETDKTDQAK